MPENNVTCPQPPEPAPPAETPTLIGFDEVSGLCSSGHTPLILTGYLIHMLRHHFSSPDMIEHPGLRNAIYTPQSNDTTVGAVDTGILIGEIFDLDVANMGTRPAVYVQRGKASPQRMSINDGASGGRAYEYTGEHHVIGVDGSHTLFCLGVSAGQVEALGWEVYREVQHFAPVIRRDAQLARFAVAEVGNISKVEEYSTMYAVPVVVAWHFFDRWTLQPQAPFLKSIGVGMEVE